ncbi:diaminopimelate decarboxylase [Candidatus Bathyarchaeota archaeon]|nr:diaminopimelate decarboxylase [Candidatus Bathyarchaeota archaeon]
MIKPPLSNRDGRLFIEEVSTLRLAEEYDTPLYVVSETKIRENYRRLSSALSSRYPKTRILYAAKANTNISILKILRSEGAFLDTVSPGEVFTAFKAGFKPGELLYTGTSVRNDELEYLLKSKILINVDSLSQLRRILDIEAPKTISFRVNPKAGAGHHKHVITAGAKAKFGLWEDEALEAYRIARDRGVEKFGIQMHIGSGILELSPYLKGVEKFFKILGKIGRSVGISFEFIDLGGGLGVPYRPEQNEINIEHFSDEVARLFREGVKQFGLEEPELWIEPGRYLIADAGILLTKVNTLKSNPTRKFAGVDAGFNTLIRPILYGSYHHILVANKLDEEPTETYDVVGPICESGDALARDRRLPRLSEGDLLAVLNAGAYGFSMCSNYNSRPKPAEALVKKDEHTLIRARESFEDLLLKQRIPDWLMIG